MGARHPLLLISDITVLSGALDYITSNFSSTVTIIYCTVGIIVGLKNLFGK